MVVVGLLRTVDLRQSVVAETVRTLAAKLDQARASDTAASASAVLALARELSAALDHLRSRESRRPSPLEEILARRDAKLAVLKPSS